MDIHTARSSAASRLLFVQKIRNVKVEIKVLVSKPLSEENAERITKEFAQNSQGHLQTGCLKMLCWADGILWAFLFRNSERQWTEAKPQACRSRLWGPFTYWCASMESSAGVVHSKEGRHCHCTTTGVVPCGIRTIVGHRETAMPTTPKDVTIIFLGSFVFG